MSRPTELAMYLHKIGKMRKDMEALGKKFYNNPPKGVSEQEALYWAEYMFDQAAEVNRIATQMRDQLGEQTGYLAKIYDENGYLRPDAI